MSAGIRAGASNDGYLQVNGIDVLKLESNGRVKQVIAQPAFRLSLAAAQILTSAVEAPVLWDTVELNIAGAYSAGTGRWTPTVPGWYQINAAARSGGGAVYSSVAMSIYQNTTIVSRIGQLNVAGVGSCGLAGGSLVHLNGTTDYIVFQAICVTSSGTPQVDGNVSLCNMSGFLVRSD